MKRNLYQVTQSYKRGVFGKPKNGKFRFVDVPEFLMGELKEYILHIRKEGLKSGHGGDVDLLFFEGQQSMQVPFTQRRIQGLMKKVCKSGGLRERSPHQLRHSYATTLLMAHQSVAYVSKLLGHSSIDTTIRYYCHWIPGEGRGGLDDALCPKPKTEGRLVEGL
ncbi:MAG: tyrosine-type recombinase/integrase [Deltaproteobacteria bacterium]|nr:tyrosine-type recombinase/integrase [Deltaproteobacteria bacterium]